MEPAPTAPDDVTLLLAVARHDEVAFGELYDRLSRPVFSMIVRIVGSHAEAEEVLQESFWQVWERGSSYRWELGSPFCWIVTIARRKAIDRLRANSRHLHRIGEAQVARNDDDFASPVGFEKADADEQGLAVRAALARLNPDERRAVVLAFFDGLTHVEIAEALRNPVGTVKARIRRAMMKLRPALAGLRQAHDKSRGVP